MIGRLNGTLNKPRFDGACIDSTRKVELGPEFSRHISVKRNHAVLTSRDVQIVNLAAERQNNTFAIRRKGKSGKHVAG